MTLPEATPPREPAPAAGPGPVARALVLKSGVGLGGLPERQREWSLALVWAALPAGITMTEPQVNQHLKAALAGVGAFLDIDHVELRRWLVDAGWLQRDGYGRAYQRVDAAALPQPQAAMAGELAGTDITAWAAGLRADEAARREARRRAHEAAQSHALDGARTDGGPGPNGSGPGVAG